MRSLALLCLVWLTAVAAWEPDYILRVSEQTIASDCQPRSSVVINGTSPGPLITFQEGQHAWVRVYNDMPDKNTTIHFHGFTQYASPFSDGTPLASGWPIPPGHFYDYEFQLQPGFIGTYWYHSHVNPQVVTAQGPVIVEQANKAQCPVEYDEEIVMMVSDYYHATDEELEAGVLNTTVFGWLGEPQNLLVNGNAIGKCNESALLEGQTCTTDCGNNKQLVKPNTRYRVRIIGSTILSYVGLALEGHKMTIFEVDVSSNLDRVYNFESQGTYVDPLPVEDLEFGVAQRYSVLIETMADPPKQDWYWRLRTMWRPTRVNGSALWTYDDNAPSDSFTIDSISQDPTPTDLNQTVFLPNETFGWVSDQFVQWNKSQYAPSDDEVTRVIVLNGQQLVDGQGFRWSVNNELNNSTLPNIPYLVQFYAAQTPLMPNYSVALANGGYDAASNSYPARLDEVLDIVIQNRAGPTSGMVESHPWHSHGAKYWDMGYGPGNFTYAALNASRAKAEGTPYQRDTSVAYAGPGASYNSSVIADEAPGGWRLFRIKVTDPGAWLVHCHITPHQTMGMQALFMYAAEHLPPIPDSLLNEYLAYGGGAYGQPTYDYTGEATTYVPRSYFDTMATLGAGMKKRWLSPWA